MGVRDLVSGMRIELFVRKLRGLRTLQPVFSLKQAPKWSEPPPRISPLSP